MAGPLPKRSMGLKAELTHRRIRKTRESIEMATLEWVASFHHHRLMEPLGYIPPAEAETNYSIGNFK
jgi:putative transposase